MRKKIILYELNEVPFSVIDAYCEKFPESSFAKILEKSHQFTTVTPDQKLSPWTTWPTLHRGVSDKAHMMHEIGQQRDKIDAIYPSVWQILASHGVRVGIGGSLQSWPVPEDLTHFDFYIPDTFAADDTCFPRTLESFQRFNLAMVQESGRNVSSAIRVAEALKFIKDFRKLGITVATIIKIIQQISTEVLSDWKKIRRRSLQAVIFFDIFFKQLKENRPEFSTFFTNHVASSMHRYWAAAFPGDYDSYGFSADWTERYNGEIFYSMKIADDFLAQLIAFVEREADYCLMIASSMGQVATEADELETELILTDLAQFLAKLGLGVADWERRPAMVPQSNFVVAESKTTFLKDQLARLTIKGKPLRIEKEGNFFSLSLGHLNVHSDAEVLCFDGAAQSLAEWGLEITKIEDKCGATAYHIPEGSLIIYDPVNYSMGVTERKKISSLSVAPYILKSFEIRVPEYMQDGESLTF